VKPPCDGLPIPPQSPRKPLRCYCGPSGARACLLSHCGHVARGALVLMVRLSAFGCALGVAASRARWWLYCEVSMRGSYQRSNLGACSLFSHNRLCMCVCDCTWAPGERGHAMPADTPRLPAPLQGYPMGAASTGAVWTWCGSSPLDKGVDAQRGYLTVAVTVPCDSTAPCIRSTSTALNTWCCPPSHTMLDACPPKLAG
jgi:hypothetical protein